MGGGHIRDTLLNVRIRASAGVWETKPGSATLPFFGVQPVLLTEKVYLL